MEKRVSISNGVLGEAFEFIKNHVPDGKTSISYEIITDDLKTKEDTEQIVFTFEP